MSSKIDSFTATIAIKGAYVYWRLFLVDFEEVYLFCLVTKFNDLNDYECAHKWGTFYLGIARRIEPWSTCCFMSAEVFAHQLINSGFHGMWSVYKSSANLVGSDVLER
jgi:hypothetical protein